MSVFKIKRNSGVFLLHNQLPFVDRQLFTPISNNKHIFCTSTESIFRNRRLFLNDILPFESDVVVFVICLIYISAGFFFIFVCFCSLNSSKYFSNSVNIYFEYSFLFWIILILSNFGKVVCPSFLLSFYTTRSRSKWSSR